MAFFFDDRAGDCVASALRLGALLGLTVASLVLLAGVRAPLRPATVEASAARTRGQQWRSDAFVLRSGSAAGRVLAAWKHHRRAGRVKIGAGGVVSVHRSRGRGLVQVLWRDGARLGLIALTATRGEGGARTEALAYAQLADKYLKTALPTTAWGKVMAQVRANGSVSEQTALEAFAL